jgi:hypothetical protein
METQKNEKESGIKIESDTLIFKSPFSEYTPEHEIGIESISIDDHYTRIDFTYISPKHYANGTSWVQIYGNAYIRPSGSDKKYSLIRAINIPIAPNKHFFQRSGQVLQFTLLFPALPKTVTQIDIIEKLAAGSYFNFFRVALTKGQPLLVNISTNFN